MSTPMISIDKIRRSPVALRPVKKKEEDYHGLVASIRTHGVLKPILVRELPEAPGEYGLIDGLQRFSAAQDAGLKEIPAYIKNMTEAEMLEAQLIANVHRVETRPVEYSDQLLRILGQNPAMTMTDLANRIGKTTSWLSERLHLVKLTDKLKSLTNENKIKVTNACSLAKLPLEHQERYLNEALNQPPNEFTALMQKVKLELAAAIKAGRQPKLDEYVPVSHLRKKSEIEEALKQPKLGVELLSRLNVNDPLAAFKLALEWVTHTDPLSVELGKQEWLKKKAEAELLKQKRAEERKQKKEEEANIAIQAVV